MLKFVLGALVGTLISTLFAMRYYKINMTKIKEDVETYTQELFDAIFSTVEGRMTRIEEDFYERHRIEGEQSER